MVRSSLFFTHTGALHPQEVPDIQMYNVRREWRWLSDSFPADETGISSGLDFRQSSFHHIVRVLRRISPHCLWALAAFLKCCFPRYLSASGYSDDPKIILLILAPCGSDTSVRDMAHHLAFEHLQFVDMTFDRTVAPGQRECRLDSRIVTDKTTGEVVQFSHPRIARRCHPCIEVVGAVMAQRKEILPWR